MESFGEYLKREREFRNISLDEISKTTRINKKFFQAIESGNYHVLPGKAFVKGFLKAYCNIVGLDTEEVLLRFETSLETKPAVPSEAPRFRIIVPPNVKYFLPPALFIIALILIFLFTGKEKNTPPSPPGIPSSVPVDNITLQGEVSPASKPQGETGGPSVIKSHSGKGLVLKAKAIKDVWIMVRSDDKPPVETTLKVDEEYIWKASERMSVRIGNAGGVSLTLNDEPLESLGPEGKVVGLVFSSQ